MEDLDINILLIEDSDADVQAFKFQILKNPQLRHYNNIHTIHKPTLQEALDWLNSSGISPYMICLDLGVPGLSETNWRQVLDRFSRYVPEESIIVLSGADSTSNIWRALESAVGRDNLFKKESIWRNQQPILDVLLKNIAQRSSGSSRIIQMDIVRLQEKIAGLQDRLTEVEKEVDPLAKLVLMGDESIAAITRRYSREADLLAKKADVVSLSARVKAIEDARSADSLQMRLARMNFVYKIAGILFLAFLAIALVRFLGLTISEVIDLIKTVLS